jgi:hypothetical protein
LNDESDVVIIRSEKRPAVEAEQFSMIHRHSKDMFCSEAATTTVDISNKQPFSKENISSMNLVGGKILKNYPESRSQKSLTTYSNIKVDVNSLLKSKWSYA